jgi:hypothetical protein
LWIPFQKTMTAMGLAAILAFSFLLWHVAGRRAPLSRHFWPGLAAKLLAGGALGWVYAEVYGGGDTWAYFHDAQYLAQHWSGHARYWHWVAQLEPLPAEAAAHCHASGVRAYAFSLLASAVMQAVGANYWLAGAVFSLWSFGGMWALANQLCRQWEAPAWPTALAWLYWPSVLFWSAGLLKESLLMGALGWAFVWILRLRAPRGDAWRALLPALLGLWLLWHLKYYYFAAFVAASACWLGADGLAGNPAWRRRAWLSVPLLLALAGGGIWLAQQAYPALRLPDLPRYLWENSRGLAQATDNPANLLALPEAPTWGSLAKQAPLAFWEGMLRPYGWEDGPWLKRMASIDGLGLGLALLLALYRPPRWTALRGRAGLALGGVLLYVAVLGILLPLAAPNIGTLVRYRIGYWVWILWLALLAAWPRRHLPPGGA